MELSHPPPPPTTTRVTLLAFEDFHVSLLKGCVRECFAGEMTFLIVKCPKYRQSDMWIARQMVVNISGALLNSLCVFGAHRMCVWIYVYIGIQICPRYFIFIHRWGQYVCCNYQLGLEAWHKTRTSFACFKCVPSWTCFRTTSHRRPRNNSPPQRVERSGPQPCQSAQGRSSPTESQTV